MPQHELSMVCCSYAGGSFCIMWWKRKVVACRKPEVLPKVANIREEAGYKRDCHGNLKYWSTRSDDERGTIKQRTKPSKRHAKDNDTPHADTKRSQTRPANIMQRMRRYARLGPSIIFRFCASCLCMEYSRSHPWGPVGSMKTCI
jgi:hypothetical protein